MTEEPSGERLAQTPLHALHLRLGAKMVAFAGYDMPLHYRAGLLKEHLHTRNDAGLFDVSHMGQLRVSNASGDVAALARALETLIPIDIEGLEAGRQRYGFLLDEAGGILDDLMVANLGDHLSVVVNAANKQDDFAYLRSRLPPDVEIAFSPDALIALQGPRAEAALARLAPDVGEMAFMDMRRIEIAGSHCLISRSGYTGEDGFEISVPAREVEPLAEALLAEAGVAPVGLGARDSLRLEAGLCLHGADIDRETTPVEASLAWAIPSVRRRGGAREGGFPGADRILGEIETGPDKRRVGLRAEGRLPVRAGAPVFDAENAAAPVGRITSGCFSPSLQTPVAMGYLPAGLSKPGQRVFGEVRGQRVPMTICRLPFMPSRFKRPASARIHQEANPC